MEKSPEKRGKLRKNVPVVELDTIKASDIEGQPKRNEKNRIKNIRKGVKKQGFKKCIKNLHPKLHPKGC